VGRGGAGRDGAKGQGGGDEARGSVGRGRDAARPRVGPCVSSRAGAPAGHGRLCGPAGPGRAPPLVVPVTDRGPRVEAALCCGWSGSLYARGEYDDAKASLVPVRDGARGLGSRAQNPENVFLGSEEARMLGHLRVTGVQPGRGSRAKSLCALPGTCARSRERSAAQNSWLCRAGSEGELVTLPERILPSWLGSPAPC
jgi:hypothetical protein